MSRLPDSKLRLVGQRQLWRAWEGAAVFFDPLSGDTHRIASPGGHILTLLAESEISKAVLYSALNTISTSEKMDEALELLLAMELVESA